MVVAILLGVATVSSAWPQSRFTTGTAASNAHARHGHPSAFGYRYGYRGHQF
jgi:hypothetical protein